MLLHEIGPPEPTKENAQLSRQNDFYVNYISILLNNENTMV